MDEIILYVQEHLLAGGISISSAVLGIKLFFSKALSSVKSEAAAIGAENAKLRAEFEAFKQAKETEALQAKERELALLEQNLKNKFLPAETKEVLEAQKREILNGFEQKKEENLTVLKEIKQDAIETMDTVAEAVNVVKKTWF